jgi:hypothetical protein
MKKNLMEKKPKFDGNKFLMGKKLNLMKNKFDGKKKFDGRKTRSRFKNKLPE